MHRLAQRDVDQQISIVVEARDGLADPFPLGHHPVCRTKQPEQPHQVHIIRRRHLAIRLDRGIDARAEHLPRERRRHMDRRNIVHIGLESELRVERQRDLLDVDEVIERIIGTSIFRRVDESGHSDLADAIGKALRLKSGLDLWETSNAFFGGRCHRVEKDLLVRAAPNTFLIAAAPALINEHDAVLGPFVDRAAGTRRQTSRISAVVADAGKVIEPRHVVGAHYVGSVIDAAAAIVLADVGVRIILFARTPGKYAFARRGRFEYRTAAINGLIAALLPVLPVEQPEQVQVPRKRIRTVRFGLDVVPEHIFLSLARRPGRFAGQGAGLTCDALVGVEDRRKLLFRAGFGIPVGHLSSNLPVVNASHILFSVFFVLCSPNPIWSR